MSNPIRILNLFTIMNRGGAETMVMNYYRHLDRNKMQFDFMVHREQRGAYDDEIESLGGKIYRMSPIAPQNLLKYKQQLKDFFDEHDEYKIIHSHMSELGVFVFKEAILHGIPIRICHAHNAPVFSKETTIEKIKRLPREILAREMRSLASDYFACSNVAGEWLFGKKNVSRLVFMRNAIDSSLFTYNKVKSEKAKSEFGWGNKFVIGHVGRFCPQKNHSYLIDVFNAFHRENPNSILALVGGTGELESDIRGKVNSLNLADSVLFMGVCSDMPKLYLAFDLFLFPSFYEGLPVSLVEAQAAGLPCVLSSSISMQTKMTPYYYPISLDAPMSEWVNAIKNNIGFERRDTSEYIKKAGFDITENAEWLTNYYLNRLKSV